MSITHPPSKSFSPHSCSWLHHSDATVGSVGAVETSSKEEEDSNKLVIHAILSEATLGKFMAKFGNSVTVSESKDIA